MTKLIKMETISLKEHSEINEKCIQDFIFEHPEVLGSDELSPVSREKKQPNGGRIDLLLEDNNNTRYEVEIQLGATDPSHIIRTIEYWNEERKRYPQYDHCAVIIAEEITGRFQDIISLFNGQIPLIAIQLTASKIGEDIHLSFIKILDRRLPLNEDEEKYEPANRQYWEKKTNSTILQHIDNIFQNFQQFIPNYRLNYTKSYIGINKDGISRNLILFKPKNKYLYLLILKTGEAHKFQQLLEDVGLSVDLERRHYRIRLQDFEEYRKNAELINKLVENAVQENITKID